jgi:hypothetical protein
MEDSTAQGQEAELGEASRSASEARRKAKDVSVDEYLWAAQTTGALKGMARLLNVSYSSMCRDIERRGIKAHLMNLFPETGKPGVRNVPPLASIEGAGPDPEWDVETIKNSAIARSDAKKARAHKKANQEIRFPHGPVCLAPTTAGCTQKQSLLTPSLVLTSGRWETW